MRGKPAGKGLSASAPLLLAGRNLSNRSPASHLVVCVCPRGRHSRHCFLPILFLLLRAHLTCYNKPWQQVTLQSTSIATPSSHRPTYSRQQSSFFVKPRKSESRPLTPVAGGGCPQKCHSCPRSAQGQRLITLETPCMRARHMPIPSSSPPAFLCSRSSGPAQVPHSLGALDFQIKAISLSQREAGI